MRRLAAVTSAAAFFATGCGGHDANPAIVRVQLEGATHAADVATGFVAQPGRVVTVAHVLEPDRRLVVVRSGKSQPGRVVRVAQHLVIELAVRFDEVCG